MDITTLAATAAALLAPLLAKGAEKFAEEFGKDVYERGKVLLDRVRRRFKGKPAAEQVLDECTRAPGPQSEAALARTIEGELAASPALLRAWAPLVQELAARVETTRQAGSKYQVAAKIVGAVGDGAQATFNLKSLE